MKRKEAATMPKNEKFNQRINDGPKPPCGKDCAERQPGCAANCEKWREYAIERNNLYAERLAEKEKKLDTYRSRAASERAVYRKKKNMGYFK